MGYGRGAKIDSNQPIIVDALRAIGAKVLSLAPIGDGVFDLLVGWKGKLHLLEVKNMSGRGDKLTPAEEVFANEWAEYPLFVVRNTIEAMNAIGIEWGV